MPQQSHRDKPESFEDFYTFHRLWARQDGYRIAGNYHDAEALSMHAFEKAYEGWDFFRNKGNTDCERAWLHKTMERKWIDEVRRRGQADEIDRPTGRQDGNDAKTMGDSITGASLGNEEDVKEIYYKSIIADVLALIRSNPAFFGLAEADLNCFMSDYELGDEKVVVREPHVKTAIARARRVIRDLCLARIRKDQANDDAAGNGETEAPAKFWDSVFFRNTLDQRFDVVMKRLVDEAEKDEAKKPEAEFVSWTHILVFKTYYSGDDPGVYLTGEETYEMCRKFGVARGSIGGWLQEIRPLFCRHFEQDHKDLVDCLEEIYRHSPLANLEQRLVAFSRREKLLLAGRGYPIPQQTFPPGHLFVAKKFPRDNEVNP